MIRIQKAQRLDGGVAWALMSRLQTDCFDLSLSAGRDTNGMGGTRGLHRTKAPTPSSTAQATAQSVATDRGPRDRWAGEPVRSWRCARGASSCETRDTRARNQGCRKRECAGHDLRNPQPGLRAVLLKPCPEAL